MNVETRWPPISARGCAGSALGEPSTITTDAANGIAPSGKPALAENTPFVTPTLESNAGPQGRVPMDYRPGSQSGLRHRRIILVAIQVALATETILPGVTLLSRIIAHIRARSLLRVFCG